MKSYCSLGLMSGTSADGVDASIIQSDGDTEYKVIIDKYFKYDQNIYENIHNLKEKINDSRGLKNLTKKIEYLEKEITLFHANAVNEIIEESKLFAFTIYSLKVNCFARFFTLSFLRRHFTLWQVYTKVRS